MHRPNPEIWTHADYLLPIGDFGIDLHKQEQLARLDDGIELAPTYFGEYQALIAILSRGKTKTSSLATINQTLALTTLVGSFRDRLNNTEYIYDTPHGRIGVIRYAVGPMIIGRNDSMVSWIIETLSQPPVLLENSL